MTQSIPTAMLSLLTVLLSGVTGGAVAAYMSYRLGKRKEDIAFMVQKAEDLFACADEWLTRLGTHFYAHYGLFRNELDFNQVNQLTIETGKDEGRNVQKLKMHVSIYFPELQGALDKVYAARGALNTIISDYKRAYKSGDTDGRPRFAAFHEAMTELPRVSTAFLQEIADTATTMAAHRVIISGKRRARIPVKGSAAARTSRPS